MEKCKRCNLVLVFWLMRNVSAWPFLMKQRCELFGDLRIPFCGTHITFFFPLFYVSPKMTRFERCPFDCMGTYCHFTFEIIPHLFGFVH